MSKSKGMQDFLDRLSQSLFHRNRSDCIRENICVACGGQVETFPNEVSQREYQISGLGPCCQEYFFNGSGY